MASTSQLEWCSIFDGLYRPNFASLFARTRWAEWRKIDASAQGLADLETTRSYHQFTEQLTLTYNNIPHSLSFRPSITLHLTQQHTTQGTWLSRESTRSSQISVGMLSNPRVSTGHPLLSFKPKQSCMPQEVIVLTKHYSDPPSSCSAGPIGDDLVSQSCITSKRSSWIAAPVADSHMSEVIG